MDELNRKSQSNWHSDSVRILFKARKQGHGMLFVVADGWEDSFDEMVNDLKEKGWDIE